MKIYENILGILGLSILLSTTSCFSANKKMAINTDTLIGNYTTIATANYADAIKDAETFRDSY